MVRFRNQVKVLTKVKSLSPNHRIVIALYSPGGVVETGLPMCPPEKWRESLPAGFSGTVSPVRFDGKTCAIAAISRDFRSNAAEFLCIPDCVAEREGFEPPIPFRVCRFSSTQKGSDRFGKFFTVFYFSTAYKSDKLIRCDPICRVLTIELLQFYYSFRR